MRYLSATLLTVALTCSASAQNFLNNASFETPLQTATPFFSQLDSASVVTGFNTPTTWNIIAGGNVDIIRVGSPGYWNAAAQDGIQVLELAGSTSGTIRQTVSVSGPVNLSFGYSRNLDYTGTDTFTGRIRIFDGANVYLNTTVTRNAGTDGASLTNFNFSTFNQTGISVGTSTSVTLEFSDITTGGTIPAGRGIVIDNVVLTPEPTTMIALGLAGVGGFGLIRRRYRRTV